MRYKFFANSQKSWQAMYEAISSAKESIYLEMYIFQSNLKDFDFFKLLKEKAEGGIKVKMILDSFGSYDLNKKEIQEIKDSGIELLFLSYFLHRTHRKILVVDGSIAFIGGVNIHQAASLWNDLVVMVRGKLVRSIIRSYVKAYIEAGGKDHDVLVQKKRKSQRITKIKMRDWLVEHSPIKNKFNLKKIYKKHLADAKESIILVTPYFMPKRWLVGALHQAYLRGVNVEVLVPQNTDIYFLDRLNYFYVNKISRLGINFYMESKMNHAKIMVIDFKEGIVGSNNLDYLSFELNSEVGIFFNDHSALNRISKIINEWKKDSTLFDSKKYKMKLMDYVLSPFINVFSRFF